MRILVLGGLLLALCSQTAGAADLGYGYRGDGPPAPVYREREAPPTYQDDEDDGPRWRESRRPRHYHQPRHEDADDGDCWVRRTPWGPERVCR